MDEVDRELSRIIKSASRQFPSLDWNKEDDLSIGKFDRTDDAAQLSTFYFLDRADGNDCHGDTSLHRMLAMHAPSTAIKNYLALLERHHAFVDCSKGEVLGMMSSRIADEFTTMPVPTSLEQQNGKGVTALHMAIYRNSWHVESIVAMLMESQDPKSKREGRHLASVAMAGGSYPLHVMCGHNMTIQKEVLKMLLRADPNIVSIDDKHGDNPLSLLWKNVLRFRWAISMEKGDKNIDYVNDGMSWMTVIAPEQYLLYSLLMIRALSSTQSISCSSEPHGCSLHEICAAPRCPPLLLRLALYPKYKSLFNITGDVYTLDEQGMLPIHHAVQMPPVTHRFVPPHFDRAGAERLKSVVELLLDEYPESVTVEDHQGRLPLHYALESGRIDETSLFKMIRLYPESLRLPDPVSGLYPFMLVAAETARTLSIASSPLYIDHPADQVHSCLAEPTFRQQAEWKRDRIRMSYVLLQICPEVVQLQSGTEWCGCR